MFFNAFKKIGTRNGNAKSTADGEFNLNYENNTDNTSTNYSNCSFKQ